MHATTVFLSGLMAAAASAKTLHYAVPHVFAAAGNCTMPADFEVINFTLSTPGGNSTESTISFQFIDEDTGIDTLCEKNATSKATGPSHNEYPCDNTVVKFIYQTSTSGTAGLDMIEEACPGNSPAYEASGLVRPDLTCAQAYAGKNCVAKGPVQGDFTSLEPVPM